jgi:hypothetical protein
MSKHNTQTVPAVTYGAKPHVTGPTLTCPRCKRVHAFPKPEKSTHCECGWRYFIGPLGNVLEDFKPPMG